MKQIRCGIVEFKVGQTFGKGQVELPNIYTDQAGERGEGSYPSKGKQEFSPGLSRHQCRPEMSYLRALQRWQKSDSASETAQF